MFWPDHDLSAWGWVVMVAGMVIVGRLLIGPTVALVRVLNRAPEWAHGPCPTPEKRLAERFTQREIDDGGQRRRLVALSFAGQVVNRP